MIKRIFLIAVCISVLISSVSAFAFTDVDSTSIYGKAIEVLSEAGVLSGYGNGKFGSKDHLTRAQFAKIIVTLSGYENAAKAKTTEIFTDVPTSHWAIGYINEASNLGLITGYPDGRFGAEEKITYAQALTIIIRMLGYTEAEIGTNWPSDYINKATELEIIEGITFGRNDYISREVAAYIIYNSLTAKEGANSGFSKLKKYENVIFYGTNEINSGIATDEVVTSGGTFKKGSAFKNEYLGKRATVRVNAENELVMVIPEEEEPSVYTVITCDSNEMETIENGYVRIDSGSNIYYKGSKVSYQSVYSSVTAGSKAYVYGDYIYIESNEKENREVLEEDFSAIYDSFGEVLTKIEDAVIFGVNSVNSGIASDEVVTSEGTFKKGKADVEGYLGRKVTLRINSEKEIVMITPEKEVSEALTLISATNDKIETTENGVYNVDGNIAVYYKGGKSTYSALYPSLLKGSKVFIYDDYIYIEENKLKGPFTVTKDFNQLKEVFGNIENADITVDGEKAKLSDIKKYDVVYYNDITGRIYAYTEKVTGIYEKAIPQKRNLTGIVLSGKTYDLISADAAKKLDDSLGAFRVNDRITLLYGNDGTVVDVVDVDGKTLGDMGVLLKAYSKISTDEDTLGKNEYFADLFLADGSNVTYKTDKEYKDTDYTEYTGKFVYITNLNNGSVKLEIAEENQLEGVFDKSVPSYGGYELQQNYSIIELVYSEKYKEAVVRKVNLKDISVSKLTASDVIHVEYANEMNDIAVIYVNNITNDSYTFGVLNKAVKDEEANFTYELKSSSGTTTYSGTAGWDFVKGEAVMALVAGNKLKEIKGLYEVANCSNIESYTDTKIKINGRVYLMDEKVSVIYKNIGDDSWNITTLKDLNENTESGLWKAGSINVYADKKTGGKVRVIRVTLK